VTFVESKYSHASTGFTVLITFNFLWKREVFGVGVGVVVVGGVGGVGVDADDADAADDADDANDCGRI
jgi:hypothetical protein